MKTWMALPLAVVTIAVALPMVPTASQAPTATMTPLATGLNNPRGLKFGPDGNLYVAEAGLGGTAYKTTPDDCDQVVPPVGPYSGDYTSRISRIDGSGMRTTVIDGLPSSQTAVTLGSLASGVADVAFIDGELYGIEAGAGCSHGLAGTDNTVFRVNGNGTTTEIADLSDYQKANPVAQPEEEDFEPDGTWYSMIAVRGLLYAVEPNHGEIVRIDPRTGTIARVIDVSASQGHIVPTAVAYKGNFFFGNLSTFPVTPGSSGLFKVTPSGQIQQWASGLTTVLGLAVGSRDQMYVLESMTAPGFPGPGEIGTGRITRVDPNGATATVADGFSFATGMAIGPDGALYVSDLGFAGPGAGKVWRVAPP